MYGFDGDDNPSWVLLAEAGGTEPASGPAAELALTDEIVQTITIGSRKKIALVAHNHKKRDLLEWAKFNRDLLACHDVYATGTTGQVLERELGFPITNLQSGPLGGDQQIGGKISEGVIDFLIFFWDPLQPMPHDPDVKALLRLAVVWNIPIACNRSSADFVISSPLMADEYERIVPDYEAYRSRPLSFAA